MTLLDWEEAYLQKMKDEDTDRRIFWLWSTESITLGQRLSELKGWVWVPSTIKSAHAKIGSALKQCKPRREVPGIVVELLGHMTKSRDWKKFAVLEEMKRGFLSDPRWSWKEWRIEQPTLLVIANEPPIIDMMTDDKLVVTHLNSFIDSLQNHG